GRPHALSRATWSALAESVGAAVAAWHAAKPDWIGIRLQDLRSGFAPALREAAAAVAGALAADGTLVKEGPYYRLPQHQPVLGAEDEALWRRVAPRLEGEGGRPPRVHELAEALAIEPRQVSAFLERAARAGRCHRVAANRFFLPQAIERLAALAAQLDAESEGAGFSVARYRDASGLGRNLTIQVLEYLDELGCTRRVGELRHAIIDRTIGDRTTGPAEEQRTPVGRPDFKSGERRQAPLA